MSRTIHAVVQSSPELLMNVRFLFRLILSKHRLLPGSSCSQLDPHSPSEPLTMASVEIRSKWCSSRISCIFFALPALLGYEFNLLINIGPPDVRACQCFHLHHIAVATVKKLQHCSLTWWRYNYSGTTHHTPFVVDQLLAHSVELVC